MAQTKSRASNGGTRKSKPKSRKATKPRSNAAKSRSNGGQAKGSVERTAKGAGRSVGRAAGKAKLPLVAGGAALVGAAGGLAMAGRRMRRRPQIKVSSRDVANVAKEVGSFSAQMGRLASELQNAREAGDGKGRSPVEVVLEGLTSRRSR
jgi:hypothetical protein